MMDGNFDSILVIQPDKYDEEVSITGNGKTFTGKLCTSMRLDIVSAYQNNMQNRDKIFKAQKKLDVIVPIEVVTGREQLFPGWKPADNGKASFQITKSEEIVTASTIEAFVVEPSFTWAEAVVFGRINGSIALKLQAKIMKWLTDEGLIESKND